MEQRAGHGGGPGGEGREIDGGAGAPLLAAARPASLGPRFTGVSTRAIDDKGRLVLPPPYRHEFAAGGFLRPVEDAIALWPPEEMDRMRAHLVAQGRAGQLSSRNALRALAANAPRFVPDSQGRIPVPAELRARAGIEVDVVVAGVDNAVELWSPARWERISDDGEATLAAEWATYGL